MFHNLSDNGGPGQMRTGNSAALNGLALRSRDPASTPHGVECGGAALLTSAIACGLGYDDPAEHSPPSAVPSSGGEALPEVKPETARKPSIRTEFPKLFCVGHTCEPQKPDLFAHAPGSLVGRSLLRSPLLPLVVRQVLWLNPCQPKNIKSDLCFWASTQRVAFPTLGACFPTLDERSTRCPAPSRERA